MASCLTDEEMETTKAKLLIKSAKRGDFATVKDLVSEDRNLIHARDRDGSLPMHCAAWKGHYEIVAFLIGAGTDVDAENENSHWGTTALHAASHGNQKKVDEVLIEKGADLNYRSPLNNLTPLGHTRVHNAKAVARILVDRGAVE